MKPPVWDARRGFRRVFFVCFVLAAAAAPIAGAAEVPLVLPEWGAFALVAAWIALAAGYAAFLAFASVGLALFFRYRRTGYAMTATAVATAIAPPILLAMSGLRVLRAHVDGVRPPVALLSFWVLIAMIIGMSLTACAGWTAHSKSSKDDTQRR